MNKTKIGWTDYTWNPVTGCEHGCSYCYARKIARRHGKTDEARKFTPEFHEERLSQPLFVKKPSKIFVCSMADLFGEWVQEEWITRVLRTVDLAPQHTFLFLTKNPVRYLNFMWSKNAWLGATATDQDSFDKVSAALSCMPNSTLFISVEPMLGPIVLNWSPEWLIIGPETGRPGQAPPAVWIRDLTNQAVERNIPVFHKRACGPGFNRREFSR